MIIKFYLITILQFNKKQISWKFVRKLYQIATENTGLTALHKLKYEHVHLTPFSKMRVDLAAQVNQLLINLHVDKS